MIGCLSQGNPESRIFTANLTNHHELVVSHFGSVRVGLCWFVVEKVRDKLTKEVFGDSDD